MLLMPFETDVTISFENDHVISHWYIKAGESLPYCAQVARIVEGEYTLLPVSELEENEEESRHILKRTTHKKEEHYIRNLESLLTTPIIEFLINLDHIPLGVRSECVFAITETDTDEQIECRSIGLCVEHDESLSISDLDSCEAMYVGGSTVRMSSDLIALFLLRDYLVVTGDNEIKRMVLPKIDYDGESGGLFLNSLMGLGQDLVTPYIMDNDSLSVSMCIREEGSFHFVTRDLGRMPNIFETNQFQDVVQFYKKSLTKGLKYVTTNLILGYGEFFSSTTKDTKILLSVFRGVLRVTTERQNLLTIDIDLIRNDRMLNEVVSYIYRYLIEMSGTMEYLIDEFHRILENKEKNTQ